MKGKHFPAEYLGLVDQAHQGGCVERRCGDDEKRLKDIRQGNGGQETDGKTH